MRIEIAPNCSCDDWDTLRTKLAFHGNWAASSKEWERAIGIVEKRLRKRFLDLAHRLDGSPYAGFAILALDCLLIETIQAFRSGSRAANSKQSRKAHTALLTTAQNFKSFFTQTQADAFYSNVRNGLLHDGETRKGWLVKTNPKYALLDPQPKGFFIVNRRKFHAALLAEFDQYLLALRDPSQNVLRGNLVKALDDLCARSKP